MTYSNSGGDDYTTFRVKGGLGAEGADEGEEYYYTTRDKGKGNNTVV